MSEHEKFKILVSAFIDGETTPEEEAAIKEHIVACPSCQKLLKDTRCLSSLLKEWPDEPLSPDSECEIKKNLKSQEGPKMKKKSFLKKTGIAIFMVVIVGVALRYYGQRALQGRLKDSMAYLQTAQTTSSRQRGQITQVAEKVEMAVSPVRIARSLGKSLTTRDAARRSRTDDIADQYEPYYLQAEMKSKRFEEQYDGSIQEQSQGIMIDVNGNFISGYEKFNTEQYDRIYENPFLKAMENPLSTFSIDVDTASYSNVRRFLNNNQMPPQDAVRIEELINYFSYDYPLPQGEHPFSITTKAAVCPWNQDHDIALVGLQGKILEEEEIPPSNLVFLIDVSGSMNSSNKLPLLKSAFNLLVDQLGANDRVALVVYSGAAGVILESTPGDQKMTILNAINTLNAGGSTAGGSGIKLAYEIAAKNMIEGGNNRVILATDGDFNVGVSSDGELTRLIEGKRDQGVFLTVLGFGMGNYKDSRMEKLADKGNGNYSYIDTLKEAKKVLVHELGSTIFTIAKDVKIQIEFNPAQVKAYRLIGYENRMLAKEDFNDDTKDAGELGAGHTVTAIYEIVPVASDETFGNVDDLVYQKQQVTGGDDLMTVKFRYKEPDDDMSQLITQSIQKDAVVEKLTGDFEFVVAVAEFGLLLRDSKYKGAANYDEILRKARASQGKDAFGYRSEFISLVEKAKAIDMRSLNKGIQFKGRN